MNLSWVATHSQESSKSHERMEKSLQPRHEEHTDESSRAESGAQAVNLLNSGRIHHGTISLSSQRRPV